MEFLCSFGFGISVSWFRIYAFSCNKIKPGSCLTSGFWYQLLAISSAKCSINHSILRFFFFACHRWMNLWTQWTKFRSWAEYKFLSLQTKFYNLKLFLNLFHYYHCRQSQTNLDPFVASVKWLERIQLKIKYNNRPGNRKIDRSKNNNNNVKCLKCDRIDKVHINNEENHK